VTMPQDGTTLPDHGCGVDLRLMYRAITSRLLAGDYPLLCYEVLLHSSPAISVHCQYGSKQVGFTLWPSGEAEMTWQMEAGGCCVAYYDLDSQSDLDRFLADLQDRLG
jgi:hypothetical protein